MNTKQKEIAEKILKKMKSSESGVIFIKELISFVNDPILASLIIRYLKNDMSLIDDFGSERYRLTDVGWEFESFSKLEQQKKDEKSREQLEFEKSKIDFKLAEKMLKDYPKTKWIARISIILGIGLAILEILRAIGLLDSNN